MSDMRDYLIPRQLDAPPMMLFVEADTACVGLFFVFLGLFIKQFIICFILGVLLARLYSRSKAGGGRATIMTWLYWYAPSKVLANSRVLSHERYFLG